MFYYDIHIHLHPAPLFAAIRKWFAENASLQLNHQTEPSAVAQVLRENSIKRFVFSSYAHRTNMARELNAWLVKTTKELEFYGLPLATVHPDDESYVEDLELALQSGCIGLKIHEDVQKVAVDHPRFDPVYRSLKEKQGFVLAHIGPIPWKHSTREGVHRVQKVMEKHPELNFVVAHLGTPDTHQYFDVMKDHPNLYLDTTMSFSRLFSDRLPLTAEEVDANADRLIYGSDYPTTPQPYGREKTNIESMNLSKSTLDKLFRGNALKLLKPFV